MVASSRSVNLVFKNVMACFFMRRGHPNPSFKTQRWVEYSEDCIYLPSSPPPSDTRYLSLGEKASASTFTRCRVELTVLSSLLKIPNVNVSLKIKRVLTWQQLCPRKILVSCGEDILITTRRACIFLLTIRRGVGYLLLPATI